MHGSIMRLVESYGYGVVFLFVAIESLGVPLPGETVLVTAGALAALGHLSIGWVIAIAALGGIMGDAAGYWIGRLEGVALIKRYGRVLHFDDAKLARVRGFFQRHGPKTVFLGRFIALLRTWAALLAGTAEMPYGVFTLYNVMGGITWAALFGTLGYPRPVDATTFLYGMSFSFPSGHALGSLVGYGMLAYVIGSMWMDGPRERVRLTIATAVLVLAIGISRLYLGVHYFSDVVAGYAVGILWLSVCISGLQVIQVRRLSTSSS